MTARLEPPDETDGPHPHRSDAALETIDTDRFGICLGCLQPIPIERLLAIPRAQRCVKCAEKTSR
ncbi:MAG: TraR/DksA C4-type zinc finger protein [Acidimicrobiia bacterium]